MLFFGANATIYVVEEAISFRKGLNGLANLCRDVLEIEPINGAYFVFRNKQNNAIKILFYDGDGFWLMHKRFSQGGIKNWVNIKDKKTKYNIIDYRDVSMLLWRGDINKVKFPEFWKKVS